MWIMNNEEDKWHFDCVRRRYKNYSEFMFWGSFTYGYKGPCYVYPIETKKDKELAQKKIDKLNKELYQKEKAEWEALQFVQDMFREGPRRGKKPSFEAYWKTIKLKRSKGGGINWWRYQTEVLKPLLIPFAKKMMEIRPNTVVMKV